MTEQAARLLHRLPYLIIAMVTGSVVALLFKYELGGAATHIATVGALLTSLPLLSMPDLSFTMSVTFFGAVFLELELAIFVGVMLSLVLHLERVSKPRIVIRAPYPRLPKRAFSSDPSLPQCPQLCFLRIDGSLFFGSVDHVEEAFASLEATAPEQKHLAVIAKGTNFAECRECKQPIFRECRMVPVARR